MKTPPPDFPHIYDEATLRSHLERGARETTPGKGTKITARIPVEKTTESKWREESIDNQPEKS